MNQKQQSNYNFLLKKMKIGKPYRTQELSLLSNNLSRDLKTLLKLQLM